MKRFIFLNEGVGIGTNNAFQISQLDEFKEIDTFILTHEDNSSVASIEGTCS
jgi:hypothetical protein